MPSETWADSSAPDDAGSRYRCRQLFQWIPPFLGVSALLVAVLIGGVPVREGRDAHVGIASRRTRHSAGCGDAGWVADLSPIRRAPRRVKKRWDSFSRKSRSVPIWRRICGEAMIYGNDDRVRRMFHASNGADGVGTARDRKFGLLGVHRAKLVMAPGFRAGWFFLVQTGCSADATHRLRE